MRGNLARRFLKFTPGWPTVHRKAPQITNLPPTNHERDPVRQEATLCDVFVVPDVLVECRICHEEDLEQNMECPCSCCGSVKYAHRSCVQRWCNEKGDTCCEICLQQFRAGYTAPVTSPPLGEIPADLSSDMVPRRGLLDTYPAPAVAIHNNITETGYGRVDGDSGDVDEDDGIWISRSAAYCRTFAITFTALFFLRHALPGMLGEEEDRPFVELTALLLRVAGILVPIYAISRAFSFYCSQCTEHMENPSFYYASTMQRNSRHLISIQ